MLASLVDVDTGRVSIQKAVYGSAYGVLVDPLTGNPYSSINPLPVASGGTTNTSVVTNYVCVVPFTDPNGTVNAGDQLINIQIFDSFGAQVASIWNDVTESFTLQDPPGAGDVQIYIPGGGATAANQVTEINLLTGITNKLPASLGAKTSAASFSTVLASDATLPLPSGAATSSLQTTGNASLATIATNTTALTGQFPASLGTKTAAGSLSVTLSSDGTVPLPTGAATAANQATEIASLATIATKSTAISAQLPASIGQTTSSGSLSVTMASDYVPALPTGAATAALQTTGNTSLGTIATNTTALTAQLPTTIGQAASSGSLSTVLASDATLPLPTGASTAALQTTGNTTLAAISAKLPATLGLQTVGGSLSVAIANGAGGEVSATALYQATAASAGEYAIGDILQSVEVYTPGTPSTLLDTIWNNLTQQIPLTVAPPATDIEPVTGGTGGGSGSVVTTSTYSVKTAGSGYAVNDTLQEVVVIDPTGPTVLSTTWNNLTQGTTAITAPVYANITASNSQLPPALGPQAAADSLSVYVQNPATGSTSVVNTYTVTTGWTDGSQAISAGETVQQILIFNSSGTLTSTVWFDVDLAYTLVAPPPSYTFVTQVTSSTATAANQTTQINLATTANTSLSTISTQLPTTLGQKASAASLSTVLASDATLPLPTGAATALKQDAGNTSLATIVTQTTTTATNTGTIATDTTALRAQLPTTLGQAASAASLAVVMASDYTPPLPTGAATSALQTTGNTSLATIATNSTTITGQLPATIGQQASAASLSTVLASDAVLPLPTGAATSANQSTANTSLATIATQTTATATSVASVDTKLPPALGPQLSADSLSVVVANQTSSDVTASFNYTVVTAWTGTTVGDLVVRYDIYTPGAPPTQVSETWFNVTEGTTLAGGPPDYSYVSASAGSTVTPVLPQVTPSLTTATGSGTVAAGAKSISFANNGSGNAIIGAAILPSGASLDFTAPSGSSIAALTYDATGTSLLIATLV